MDYTLQLYTVKAPAQRDFSATLKRVRALGYTGVESYKPEPSPQNLAFFQAAGAEGLMHLSAQLEYKKLQSRLPEYATFLRQTGCTTAVVALPPPEVMLGSIASWQRFCTQMNQLGHRCAAQGIHLAYHHHQFEFARLKEGVRPIDLLLAELDDTVSFVCDTFRAQQGGVSPERLLARLSGRLAGLHLRDYTLKRRPFAFHPTDCCLGQGNLDIPALVRAGVMAGAAYGAVEQNSKHPFEDAKASLTFLQQLN